MPFFKQFQENNESRKCRNGINLGLKNCC